MPARHNNQPWVIALRDMLRISIGSAWSITEQSGKVKITVRFQDKSKSYATVPIPWLPARSRDIEDAIIKIANLVQGGRTLKEAVEALYGTNKKVIPSFNNKIVSSEVLIERNKRSQKMRF